MKKILLVDVDSKIPNIALMRISTFYKQMTIGYKVDFVKLGLTGYPSKNSKAVRVIDGADYDKVYVSNIFSVNQDRFVVINNENVIIGGVGSVNPNTKLPEHMEHLDYDYSLYPENKIAYGFITRGCHRKCYFCAVPKTEGKISEYASIDSITKYNFKKVSFMDNNILAYENHLAILRYLVSNNITYTFNQGLDIRLVTPENLELLSKSKYFGEYIFAFDNVKYKKYITPKIELVKKYIPSNWRLKFYLFQDAKMSLEDLLIRIAWCRKYYSLPYVMRHEDIYKSEDHFIYTDISAWCNQPSLFKKMPFFQFLVKRHNYGKKSQLSLEDIFHKRNYSETNISLLKSYFN